LAYRCSRFETRDGAIIGSPAFLAPEVLALAGDLVRACWFPAFTILHICAALDPHTYGKPTKKGSASNALTSLAGHTDCPHDGWRCPGY
jgi:hypothetical protein